MTRRILRITGIANTPASALLSGSLSKILVMGFQLAMVFIDFAIIGWFMKGFDVSLIIYVGTFLVCCYLVWVGSGGVALGSIWVVALMSVAAVNQLWLQGLPRPRFTYIPLLLLTNWLLALGVVWQVGKISDMFRQKTLPRVWGFSILITFVVTGLLAGWLFYPTTLLLFSSR